MSSLLSIASSEDASVENALKLLCSTVDSEFELINEIGDMLL